MTSAFQTNTDSVWNFDQWFGLIEELVMCHSPSGLEGEIDAVLRDRLAALGHQVEQDWAGNIYVKIPASTEHRRPEAPPVAITAHKDEIGAIVKRVEEVGCPCASWGAAFRGCTGKG